MKLTIISIILSTFVSAASWASTGLENAYKREFIFLNSQLKQLKKQEQVLKKKYKQAILKANSSIEKNQTKIVGLSSTNEALEQKVFKLEQNVEIATENKGMLENTIKQASMKFGIPTDQIKVQGLVEHAVNSLKKDSQIVTEKGSFFLEDGEYINGDIIRFGKVASIGHYNNNFYQLAPAGDSKLKAWKIYPNGKNIFDGEFAPVIELFLYESLDRPITKRESKSIVEFVNSGGSIAWVIVAMGVISILLCIVRGLYLLVYKNEAKTIEEICNDSDELYLEETLSNQKMNFGAKTLFLKIIKSKDSPREHIDDIVEEAVIQEHKTIDRFGAMILVFAAVAPLMGLLGTVTGMISTFDIITEHGTGDPKLLSQGISEALITTELGLLVAIPSLLFGNVLSGFGKNIKMGLEKSILKMINGFK